MLTFEQIKELIEIVTERGLQSLEIERSGFRLRIDGKSGAATASNGTAAVNAPGPELAAAAAEEPAPGGAEGGAKALPDGVHLLKSPIVGTFYAAPSPESDPYVRAGDVVKKGQVLCIVEAMKLMNEIESDVTGKIVEILPKNAQPVEFGEPLFAILPD